VRFVKILTALLSVIVGTGLVIGGIALVIFSMPIGSSGLLWLAILAVTTFVYGPLLLGAVCSHWDIGPSAESRRYIRRFMEIVFACELLGAVSIVIFAVLAGVSARLPILLIAGAIVLTVVAVIVGRLLFQYDRLHNSPEKAWTPISRGEIVRKIGIVAVTFTVAFVVAVLLLGLFVPTLAAGGSVVMAASLASILASVACIVVSLPLNPRIRAAASSDLGRLNRLARVVLRGNELELDQDEQMAAAKYAALLSVTLPFQLGYFLLFYVGLGLQQFEVLTLFENSSISVVLLAALTLLLLAFVPMFGRQIVRARRYASDHGDLLPPGEAKARRG
jgi:magnesium-transporting ATPase (P-type)